MVDCIEFEFAEIEVGMFEVEQRTGELEMVDCIEFEFGIEQEIGVGVEMFEVEMFEVNMFDMVQERKQSRGSS